MLSHKRIVLAVLADSHVPERMHCIPDSLFESLRYYDVTGIIHAGDITSVHVLSQLERIAPVIAVRGNRDIWTSAGRSLPLSFVLKMGGVQIGITHGHGGFWSYIWEKCLYYSIGFSYNRYYQRLCRQFSDNINIIVFGHTHRIVKKWFKNTLYFNPGSVGPVYYDTNVPTFGIIEIDDGIISTRIVKISK
ncbi:MAG TPA: hypothetical protein DGM69_00870 [Chloroflexi bacterium]|nr:hypothetical protein [Chloroflexota bacterium]|tara:strand:- start:4381 stop:4953 length:573 start_codon:yes stop_codon:yes gene_type:complete